MRASTPFRFLVLSLTAVSVSAQLPAIFEPTIGPAVHVSWLTESNKTYQLLVATNLPGNWTATGLFFDGTGYRVSAFLAATNVQQFFRIEEMTDIVFPQDRVLTGLNGHPQDDPVYTNFPFAEQVALLTNAGVQLYRCDWDSLGGGPGTMVYERGDIDRLRQLIDVARSNSIEVVPVLKYDKLAMSVAPDQDPAQIRAKAYELGFRLGAIFKGRVRYWELENEDCDKLHAIGDGPGFSVSDYEDTPEAGWQQIKARLMGWNDGIHQADPRAKTIVNFTDMKYGFIRRLLDEGVDFDIIGWHIYRKTGDDEKDKADPLTYPTPIPGRKMWQHLDDPVYGRKRKVWITETNQRQGEGIESEEKQKEFLDHLIHSRPSGEYLSAGIEAIIIYEMLDTLPGGKGNQTFGVYRTEKIGNTYSVYPKMVLTNEFTRLRFTR